MWDVLKPLLSPVIGKLLNLIPDGEAKEKARMELASEFVKISAVIDTQQTEINKIEAQSSRVFVSGWRPFIGWICGGAIAWTFLLQPIAQWAVVILYPDVSLPHIPSENLLELVFAMLGLSGLRSYEKLKGVANK